MELTGFQSHHRVSSLKEHHASWQEKESTMRAEISGAHAENCETAQQLKDLQAKWTALQAKDPDVSLSLEFWFLKIVGLVTINGGSCHRYHFCCNKCFVVTSILLSRQKTCFVATNTCLFCRDKNDTCGCSCQFYHKVAPALKGDTKRGSIQYCAMQYV